MPELLYALMGLQDRSEWLTSPSLSNVAAAALTATLTQGSGQRVDVLDYTAGAGRLLLAVGRRLLDQGYEPRLWAQDLSPTAAVVAETIFFVAGIEASVAVGDTLVEDPFPSVDADLVAGHPPFGLSWGRFQDHIRDRNSTAGWYGMGLPAINDSTWLFIQRMFEKLSRVAGKLQRSVFLSAAGALSGTGSEAVRTRALSEDTIEAVLALPAGILSNVSAPVQMLVMSPNKKEDRKGRVQLVDLRGQFDTSRHQRVTRRDLRPEAVESTSRILSLPRANELSRIVNVDDLRMRRVVVHPVRAGAVAASNVRWSLDVSISQDLEEVLHQRYGGRAVVEHAITDKVTTLLDATQAFDRAISRPINDVLRSNGWQSTRLSALLAEMPVVIVDRETAVSEDGHTPILLPISAEDEVSLPGDGTMCSGRVLSVNLQDPALAPFVVGWLNSALGRTVRRDALDRAESGVTVRAVRSDERSLMRLLDEIIVPLAPEDEQEEVVAANARLKAVESVATAAREELWRRTSERRHIVARFDPLFDDSLTSWTAKLPYPVASSLWTFDTKQFDRHAAHKQAFLVWEAYAAFTATVLLSALSTDPVAELEEVATLRAAMDKANVSMARASIASWAIIIERLTSRFRRQLRHEDSDERQRLLLAFGSPKLDDLDRVLSLEVVKLLRDVNTKRNMWLGHVGTLTDGQIGDQTAQIVALMQELRAVVGDAWQGLPLVRAGSGRLTGSGFVQQVEVAMGPNTPFRHTEIVVGSPMIDGELYLSCPTASTPLALNHLMQFQQNQETARYGCYFYNRVENGAMRMVSYHLGDSSERLMPLDSHLSALTGGVPRGAS